VIAPEEARTPKSATRNKSEVRPPTITGVRRSGVGVRPRGIGLRSRFGLRIAAFEEKFCRQVESSGAPVVGHLARRSPG
jgi:hypothetical protein